MRISDYIEEGSYEVLAPLFSEILSAVGNYEGEEKARMKKHLTLQFYYAYRNRPLRVWACEYFKEYPSNPAYDIAGLGKYCLDRFGDNWSRIYSAYRAEYNPLENYDMEQVRTPNLDTTSKTSRKQSTNVSTSGSASVMPFNGSTMERISSSQGDTTTTEGSDDNQVDTSVTEKGTDTLIRHGNIGVMSSQELLSRELDLRKFDFWQRVFDDIAGLIFRDLWN